MKKIILILCLFAISCFGIYTFTFGNTLQSNKPNASYLRIHIRANSNSFADQDVKYLVKQQITDFLTPLLAKVCDKQSAYTILQANLTQISALANKVLQQNDFDYIAVAQLKEEKFPLRHYKNLTLQSGVYDALIINLGEAKGDNWWCVIYPPLCFIPTGNSQGDLYYKSKILEIIEQFFYQEDI